MLMQTFGVTNKEHYGMLWYFLEWSIALRRWDVSKERPTRRQGAIHERRLQS